MLGDPVVGEDYGDLMLLPLLRRELEYTRWEYISPITKGKETVDPKESAVYKMYFIQTRFVKNWGRDLDGFRIEFGKFGEELGKTAEEGRVQSFQFYSIAPAAPYGLCPRYENGPRPKAQRQPCTRPKYLSRLTQRTTRYEPDWLPQKYWHIKI